MRNKTLSFIGIVTLGLCVSSCNYISILTNKLKSITLSDSTSAYVVGDSFFDKCNLSIKGKYNNGNEVTFERNQVVYNLTYGSSIKDINTPFEQEGSYKLTVSTEGIVSNTLTISVFANTQYVSSIQVNSTSTIEKNNSKDVSLTLTISPTRYTVPIEYQNSDPSVVSISKVNDASYFIRGLEIGEADLTFKALKDATTYLETVFHVTVTLNQKVKIEQTYSDFVDHNYYQTSSCPTTGDVKLLVIPVWFSDSSSYILESKKENVREDLTKAYFGTSSETGWHSVSSFYKEESNNTLNITGKVSEWYTFNKTADEVSEFEGTKINSQKNLVKAATDWYFSNNPSDHRSNYDYDSDGYLDGVMLIYAAPDYQAYNAVTHSNYTGGNLWAYCYWVEDSAQKRPANPGVNVFFWASYDFMYGGNAVSRTGYSYSNGDIRFCSVDAHTYIHEMGHVFGLEDYYDYSRSTSPTAGFSMQDNNVGGHDPYSTMAFGWSDPYIPTETCEITINDFQSSHDLILLSPNWNSYNSPFDEYLLLELYTPTGLNKFDCDYQYHGNYPQGPDAVGIRLWHVDARLYTVNNRFTTNVNSSSSFYTAFNNTYQNEKESENGRNSFSYSLSGKDDYQRFNMLHLIRKDTTKNYVSQAALSSNDLFLKNSTFNMTDYSSQFYKNNGRLNSGVSLGWSFTVKNISNVSGDIFSATIQLNKA